MGNEPPLTVLDYASPRDEPDSGLLLPWRKVADVWNRVPLPMASLIIAIPLCAILFSRLPDLFIYRFGYHSYGLIAHFVEAAPLFVPMVLRRGGRNEFRNAFSFWILLAIIQVVASMTIPYGFHVFLWLGVEILAIFAFALCERITFKSDAAPSYANLLILVIGVACAWSVIDNALRFSGSNFAEHNGTEPSASDREFGISPALLAVLAWSAIAWGGRKGTRSRIGAVIFAAMTMGAFFLLFGPMFVPLARRSVVGHGPFHRVIAAMIVGSEGSTKDFDCLYEAMAEPDADCVTHCYGLPGYRDVCINGIAGRDASRAGQRFSEILLAHPNPYMAEELARLFAAQGRYETAPMLLRYVLTNLITPPGFASEVDEMIRALETMKVPQVAWPILTRTLRDGVVSPGTPVILDAQTRQRLAHLLGSDAGPAADDWVVLYNQTIASAPTPLSPAQQQEANAIVAASKRFFRAGSRLSAARIWIILQPGFTNNDVATTKEFERGVDKYVKRVDEAIAASGTQSTNGPIP